MAQGSRGISREDDDLSTTMAELGEALARVESEIEHARRMGRKTAHLEYDQKRLKAMIADRLESA